jgi:hypothetical protein
MRLVFPATTIAIVDSISADYLDERYYIGDTVSRVDVPVNLMASKTTFTFKFKDNPTKRRLTVNYTITPKVLAAFCGEQRLAGSLLVDKNLTDFTNVVPTKADTLTDLPQTNFEITP